MAEKQSPPPKAEPPVTPPPPPYDPDPKLITYIERGERPDGNIRHRSR